LCLVVVVVFAVHIRFRGAARAEVWETGGEPASAEWFGRRSIGDCGDCGAAAFIYGGTCLIRTYTCSLTSAAEASWKFSLGSWSVTVGASRHRSTDLICI
jgi:hypothetical protein